MAYKGRELLVEVDTGSGYVPVGFLQTKTLSITNEPIDVTDIDSADWRTLDDRGLGSIAMSFSGSGILDTTDTALVFMEDAVWSGTLVDMQITVGTGRKFTGFFKVTTFDRSGEHGGIVTFSMSAESSGAVSIPAAAAFVPCVYSCPTQVACVPAFAAGAGPVNGVAHSYRTIIHTGTEYLMTGDDAKIWSGTLDGVTWTQQPDLPGFAGGVASFAYNGSLYVATSNSKIGSPPSLIHTSPDLTTWTARASNGDFTGRVKCLNGVFFALFRLTFGGGGIIVRSPDGITWTQVHAHPAGQAFTDIIYDGTQYIAIGYLDGGFFQQPFIYRSTDGITGWTIEDISGTAGFELPDQIDYNCVTGTYIISNWTGGVSKSTDLTTWVTTAPGAPIPITDTISAIHFADAYGLWFVAASGGRLMYSNNDGVTWNNISSTNNLWVFNIMSDHGVGSVKNIVMTGQDAIGTANIVSRSLCT